MKMSLVGVIPQGFLYAPKEVNRMPYKPKRPCAYPGCGRLAVREHLLFTAYHLLRL